MKTTLLIAIGFIVFLQSCTQANNQIQRQLIVSNYISIDSSGQTIETRFNTPKNFSRIEVETNSYANYLRTLPLKQHGSLVTMYNGWTKDNNNVYEAVVDMSIGKRDLHQCADAIMRLKAEYLWNNKQYDQIHFNFTNGFRVDYTMWMKGNRIVVNDNKTYWKQSAKPSKTYKSFWKYMEIIFSYAGTLSLSRELNSIQVIDMQIGDVFIYGGSPGHAVVVVDMAIDKSTNKKVFMLAQSYMPAQDLQILQNPNNPNNSPWYNLDFTGDLNTPEWTFNQDELMRF